MPQLALCGGTPVRSKDFPAWPIIDENDKEILIETLESRMWGLRSSVIEDFETKFAQYCGSKYAIACANGTDAISVSLQALGIGPGDEVIVPAYTFIATAIAVLTVGALPILVDIDPRTANIDPSSIEAHITKRTKAIIPVHIAGNPAKVDAILDIAKRYNLFVVEDSAQAHGAEWKQKRLGTFGDIGTYSFQSSKNLTCGEGGAVLTDNNDLAQKLGAYINCGRVPGEYTEHYFPGGNHRLGAFQAALLINGLDRLEVQMQKREENAHYLSQNISAVEGLSVLEQYPETTRHGYHLFIIKYQKEAFSGLPKQQMIKALQKEGIPCSPGYKPLNRYAIFREFRQRLHATHSWAVDSVDYESAKIPNTQHFSDDQAIWLFQKMLLGSEEDMNDILTAFHKIQKHADEAVSYTD